MPSAAPPDRPALSAAELELKRRGRRRLIGALTIGVVAVVLLPMIFDSEPKRKETVRQEIEVQIPPKDGMPPLTAPMAPTPAADAPAAKVGTAPPAGPVSNAPSVDPKAVPTPTPAPSGAVASKTEGRNEPATNAPPAKPDTKVATKLEPKQEPKAAETAAAGFVIQIGAYKDIDNAKAVVARMKEAKLPVFTDNLPVKTGTVIRVRVGPFTSREKADSALAQVKLAGVDGKVVPLP